MAAYTAVLSAHKTAVANTADSVTLSGQFQGTPVTRVEVYNHDATAIIYVRADGTTAALAADGTYAVGPNQARIIPVAQVWSTQTAGASTEVISLISSATPAYSVTAIG